MVLTRLIRFLQMSAALLTKARLEAAVRWFEVFLQLIERCAWRVAELIVLLAFLWDVIVKHLLR